MKYKQPGKSLLCVALSLLMLFSLMPLSAFAAESDGDEAAAAVKELAAAESVPEDEWQPAPPEKPLVLKKQMDSEPVGATADEAVSSGIFEYNLTVGTVRVTSENKDDVLGDGKVSFDPSTKTLHLDDPTIPGKSYGDSPEYVRAKIETGFDKLTITGSYKMSTVETFYGFLSIGGGTYFNFKGDFDICAGTAIFGESSQVNVVSGTLNTYGESAPAISIGDSLWVENSAQKFTAKTSGGDRAVEALRYDHDTLVAVTTPFDYEFRDGTFYNTVLDTVVKSVVIETNVQYNLWVGGTRVTYNNRNNIGGYGEGKVTYYPPESILTLNDVELTGSYNRRVIYAYRMDLTVEGKATINEPDVFAGIGTLEGNLTLRGDFTINSQKFGLNVMGNVIVESGSLTAKGGSTGVRCSLAFEVKGAVNKVIMQGGERSIEAYFLNLCDMLSIVEPAGGTFENRKGIYQTDGNISLYSVIGRDPEKEFPLWVGGTRVSNSNADDIFGDGTARFNPDNGVLTLNEPRFDDTHDGCCIFADRIDLTVGGSYHRRDDEATASSFVRVLNAGLTLNGDLAFGATDSAVFAQGDVTISHTLFIDGAQKAVDTDGSIFINGGVPVIRGAECGFVAKGNLIVNGSVEGLDVDDGGMVFVTRNNGYFSVPDRLTVLEPAGGVKMSYNIFKQGVLIDKLTGNNATHIKLGVPYELWLGGTKVTSLNNNDILGDGKASYDPEENTLTLNNPEIEGTHNNSKIWTDIDGLTVKGTYALNNTGVTHAVGAKRSVTLNGSFDFSTRGSCVYAGNNISVTGGSLRFSSQGERGLVCGSVLSITDPSTTVEGSGSGGVFGCASLDLDEGLCFTSPENGYYADGEVRGGDGSVSGSCSISMRLFDIWIGKTRVTGKNRFDVLGDGLTSYDPQTYTLTLNVPAIFDPYTKYVDGSKVTIGIYLDCPHMVNIEGSCRPLNDYRYIYDYNIYQNGTGTIFLRSGNLSFRGTGYGVYTNASLQSSAVVSAVGDRNAGIYTKGVLQLNSGEVTAYGGQYGIQSMASVGVNSGFYCLTADGGEGAICAGDLVYFNYGQSNLRLLEPEGGSYSSSDWQIHDAQGNVSKHAVIGDILNFDLWVGGKRVNTGNCGDIFGDGKASYDPDTQTLTLNDPELSGAYTCVSDNIEPATHRIYANNIDLTIKGRYRMADDDITDYGVLSYGGSLTLIGDFTFHSVYTAIEAYKDLWLEGDITATSNKNVYDAWAIRSFKKVTVAGGAVSGSNPSGGGLFARNSLTVNNQVKRLELEGSAFAVQFGAISLETEGSYDLEITEPDGEVSVLNGSFVLAGTTQYVSHLVIDRCYGIWLGSTRVVEANREDILGDGKSSFDPETNTLVLSDPAITGTHTGESGKSAAVSVKDTPLTVTGSCTAGGSAGTQIGFEATGCDVTFAGDFSFSGTETGVGSDECVTVHSGTLYAGGGSGTGISCISFYMQGGIFSTTAVEAKGADRALNAVGLMIDPVEDIVVSQPQGGAVDVMNGTVTEPDGSAAKHAVLTLEKVCDGTWNSPYLIESSGDWDRLVRYQSKDGNTSGKFIRLENPVTVSTMLGTESHPFRGTFDGNNKKLILNLRYSGTCAPFLYIDGAAIQNLTVEGMVRGGIHSAGLVGYAMGENNMIRRCESAAAIIVSGSHAGGIVGHGGTSSTTLTGCVFSGTLSGAAYCGTLWGWSDTGSALTMIDCLDVSDSSFNVGLGITEFQYFNNVYYTYPGKVKSTWRPWSNNGKLAYAIKSKDGVTVDIADVIGVTYSGMIYAAEGETLSLSVAPPQGFEKEDVLFKDGSGNEISFAGNRITMPDSEVTACLRDVFGDANGDHRLNIRDVTAIQRHVAECESIAEQQLALADINCDGLVTIDDATLIQMYLAEYVVVLGEQN